MRVLKTSSVVLLLAALLAASACDQSGSIEVAVVRDSAGVTIVENTGGIWADGREWLVANEPSLTIGVLEGAPEYQLFRVRNALRLHNGHIVVAASNELRFYDSEGRYLSTSGREGGGPGEFQQLGWVRSYPGDSIVAYDFGQVRVSLLDSDGVFGRSHRITPEGEFGFVMGQDVFGDGTLLVKAPLLFRAGFAEGSSRTDEDYHTYSTTGEFIDSVATLPGPDQFIQTGSSGDSRFVAVTRPPFGRESVLATFSTGFYFGSADSYEIECYAQDGTLEMLVRRSFTPREVTNDDVSAYVDRELAEIEDDDERRQRRQAYDEMPTPETMPAYADLKVDDLGNFWVQEFEPDESVASRWTVFRSDGQMLGSLLLAADFEVSQVGDDFVLGVWRDEFDVEHIHMYGLIKPERDAGDE
jgi:hypothetical protein